MKDLKRSSNSQETRKIRKILHEEARLGISPNSDSDTEEVDLQKELFPLSHYMNNREEMIEHMFSIIKGAKLRKMLPSILKDVPLDELKADCLIHLLGMSKKRIKAILEGREINSSSDSETHSDSSSSPSKRQKADLKPFVIKQEGCSDISDNSEEVVLVDPDLDFLNLPNSDKLKKDNSGEKTKFKRNLKRKDVDKKHKRTKTKKVAEEKDSDLEEVQEVHGSAESGSENETQTEAPAEGKNLLEILELEMRARAIRALLKNNDGEGNQENQQNRDDSTQNPVSTKEKNNKQLKESTEKITPAKNFRKKKRKSDDVIVITPKVVTIDLTDENELSGSKGKAEEHKQHKQRKTLPSNPKPSIDENKSQEVELNNSPQTINNNDENSTSIESVVVTEESSGSKEQVDREVVVASCSDEKLPANESLETAVESEQVKINWAQRWLESKEVKKVVSTSKICGNIRKRIKIAKLAKKQNQENPMGPALPPPQKIEGSVGEYQLLSKSKALLHSNVEISNNNDDQDSFLLVNQETNEPTSSGADLKETSSAEQVQDVTSTKGENPPTSSAQDLAKVLQLSDETQNISLRTKLDEDDGFENVSSKSEHCYQVVDSKSVRENCGLFVTSEEELGQIKNSKQPVDKNNTVRIVETAFSSANVTTTKFTIGKPPLEIREKPLVVEQLQDESETASADNKESDIIVVNLHSANSRDDSKLGESCESFIKNQCDNSNSNCIDDTETENVDTESIQSNDSSNVKNIRESKSENRTTVDNESNQNTNNVFVDSKLKTKTSDIRRSPTQDLNEPEALEINITDEDRYIEEITEENSKQNQSENARDSDIVID